MSEHVLYIISQMLCNFCFEKVKAVKKNASLSVTQMVFGLKQTLRAFCVISLSDIDECAADRSLCQPFGLCENRPGSYVCVCNHGYVLSEDKHSCEGKSARSPSALLRA